MHHYSRENLKIYRSINTVQSFKLLQSENDSLQNWCFENGTILNAGKTTIMSFMHRNMNISFDYKFCNNLILRSQCVKYCVLLHCELYFHHRIRYTYTEGLKWCVWFVIFLLFLTSSPYLCFVYRHCATQTVAWNSITLTDSSKLETVQRKFAALFHKTFFVGKY